jgi:importin subunit beta-1
LASPSPARHTAAQVIAKVAHIELPRNLWPELVQQLLANMQTNDDNLKQATLQALGYICEEIVLCN